MPKISISSASFSYGEKLVWGNINLNIKKGEILSILGPNGCGKTTLLNCIHGNLTLDSGKIKIDEKEINKMTVRQIAKKIGYVFQEHNAPFPYTSLEIVRMGRASHRGLFQVPTRKDTQIAWSIMKEMGIEQLASKSYTKISGGERQLVLIARTLCQEPEIILFDEPTSHLDFKNQVLVLETINRLVNKGLTIIMTSHYPNHAWCLTSKVAMMGYNGLVTVGPAEEVMIEQNLSKVYDVNVKVYKGIDGNNEINFCTPKYSFKNL